MKDKQVVGGAPKKKYDLTSGPDVNKYHKESKLSVLLQFKMIY